MSGPASGVMAAAYTGRQAGEPNLLTYDMGGTSTDVALIRDGHAPVSNEIEVEYAMPIHVPMVDVRTVGAGGGSIASVNAAGLLQIGPESAGADPGPICYGKGGTRPTISDANLLLGRLDPAGFLGPSGNTGGDRVAEVFLREIGAPLGTDATEAAEAVIRMANAKMAGAIRMVSLSLGADPRDFALFAFGGAGPLHAAALARELGIPRVLIPARPGLTNALGCLVADLRHDYVQTLNAALDPSTLPGLHAVLAAQSAAGAEALARETVEIVETRHTHSVDMQFAGQSHVVRVPLRDARPDLETLQASLADVFWERFKVALEGIPARIVNANTSVIGRCSRIDLSVLLEPNGQAPAPRTRRAVVFDGQTHMAPVYDRAALLPGTRLSGPLIIEQADTTILVPPGDRLEAMPEGNLTIHVEAA